jgi:hypothetical protein
VGLPLPDPGHCDRPVNQPHITATSTVHGISCDVRPLAGCSLPFEPETAEQRS